MSSGQYIVIEGIDGCGKTTQFARLKDYIGEPSLAIHEPGSTPMAEHIRTLLKAKDIPRDPIANTFLFAAARADLIGTVVRPAIAAGRTVVSDRNWMSSAAYQTAEGADLSTILSVNKIAAAEFFEPDLFIFIDTEPTVCRERLEKRGNHSTDYFDIKGIEFFEEARRVYLQQAKQFQHTAIINGNVSEEKVWKQIETAVRHLHLQTQSSV